MNEDKSKVDELSESLYSRTRYKGVDDHRSTLREGNTPEVNKDWNTGSIDEMLTKDRRKTEQHSTLKKVFFVALLFFICAIGVAAYIFIQGGNYISSKNVDIKVLGPVSVNAGEQLELGVSVVNKNNADLESSVLYVQYPEGTRNPEDSTMPLTRAREVLGEIKAGRDATYTINSILFGEKGEVKQIKLMIEYKVKGSNATFTKEKVYDISIGDSPVSLNVDMPTSVTSGDTFTSTLTILANTSEILKNVIIRGEYPYGFTMLESEPSAREGNMWIIGDLNPGDKKTIVIRGKLSGQDDEERTFRFYAGVASNVDINILETPLAYISETLPIKRPGVGLDIKINSGNSETPVAPAGKDISATISYVNNLPANLENVRIEARLSGASLDKDSVQVRDGGFYDSTSNKIVWDRNNQTRLNTLTPGDKGNLSFSFASLEQTTSFNKNQQITIDVTIYGVTEGSSKQLSITESKTVKIASEINLTGISLFTRGPFKNTGPIPPHAEETTTYTAVLNVRNTQNDISNGKVTAQLGSNVQWLNKISPESEKVTYDESRKTITWDLGTIVSGSGFDAISREVSVQLALTPSIGQVGSAPILLTNISFTGTDSFTNVPVSSNAQAITTRISTDPSYVQGDEDVTK
jgi:hypothetical protein